MSAHSIDTRSVHDISDLPPFEEMLRDDFCSDVEAMADRVFTSNVFGLNRHPVSGGLVAFRHHDLSALAINADLGGPSVEGIAEPRIRTVLQNHIFTMNGPAHPPQRKLFARHLTPKAVGRLREVAEEAVDNLVAKSLSLGEVDFQLDFSVRLTCAFWAKVLDLTPEEEQLCVDIFSRRFSENFLYTRTEAQYDSIVRANEEYLNSIPPAVLRTLRTGGNEILNMMAADFDDIDLEGKADNVGLLVACTLVDGFHTLAVALTNIVHAMLAVDDRYNRVRADASLVDAAFTEGTRLQPPLLSTPRFALKDIEYNGLRIPEGTPITMMWILGNRDPEVFDHPGIYDLDRAATHARTFGGGPRLCPGRNVARMLGVTLLNRLTRQDVDVRPSGTPPTWTPGSNLHELEGFRVAFTGPGGRV